MLLVVKLLRRVVRHLLLRLLLLRQGEPRLVVLLHRTYESYRVVLCCVVSCGNREREEGKGKISSTHGRSRRDVNIVKQLSDGVSEGANHELWVVGAHTDIINQGQVMKCR